MRYGMKTFSKTVYEYTKLTLTFILRLCKTTRIYSLLFIEFSCDLQKKEGFALLQSLHKQTNLETPKV